MYAKINLLRYSAWATKSLAEGQRPDLKVFLKEEGAITFGETRPLFGLARGWVEVPQGSCILLKLA
jgi:hypothetical protein